MTSPKQFIRICFKIYTVNIYGVAYDAKKVINTVNILKFQIIMKTCLVKYTENFTTKKMKIFR